MPLLHNDTNGPPVSELGYLIVALVVVAAGIGGYTTALLARKRRLERRLRDLEETRH